MSYSGKLFVYCICLRSLFRSCIRSHCPAVYICGRYFIIHTILYTKIPYRHFRRGLNRNLFLANDFRNNVIVVVVVVVLRHIRLSYTRKPKQHGRSTTTAAVTVVAASTIAVKPCIDFIFSSINCWIFPFVLYL